MMEASLREQLLRIYAETRTIAVVGASADESKAAHQVPRYLQSQGASCFVQGILTDMGDTGMHAS